MALRLLVAHTPAERDAARRIEAAVFLQAFGNTPEVMEEEYGPYEDRSRFVVVLDEESGSAVGAARFIVDDPASAPVKTLVDVAGDPWHVDPAAALAAAAPAGGPVWDVASLAVDRRFRSGASGAEVTLALCHGIHEYSRRSGVEGWVTVLDDRVLRLQHMMGIPWLTMPGAASQPYLGSGASTPCTLLIATIEPHMRSTRPDVAPAIMDGVLRSIALDPEDLSADRGAPLPEPDPMPVRPAARRDTTGWRPPTARRAADPVA
ncbi:MULTISPECIES: hypothetical protein [unclassified Blastococcus]